MSDPHWTSYVGMATGIVGAITGISGAILGYVGYRKSNEIKSLDLRLELRKTINELHSSLVQLEELLPKSDKSRQRVASATGSFNSGTMVKWKQQIEDDQKELKHLAEETHKLNKEYHSSSPSELETNLVNIHKLQLKLYGLRDKYNKALESDDKERERIRNRHEKS